MKVTPIYALGGAALGFVGVAFADGNWKSKKAVFGAVGGALVFLVIGIYMDAPKTADEVIKADDKKATAASSTGNDVKSMTQEEADAIVKTIVDSQKNQSGIKHSKDWIDPNVALEKQLKGGGYMISEGKAVKIPAGAGDIHLGLKQKT